MGRKVDGAEAVRNGHDCSPNADGHPLQNLKPETLAGRGSPVRLASDWIGAKLLLFLSSCSMEGWKSKQAVPEREKEGRKGREEEEEEWLQSSVSVDDWLAGWLAGGGRQTR